MSRHREIGEHVLELLSEIDLENPLVDEELATDRVCAYVEALGLTRPQITIFSDVGELRGFRLSYAKRGRWQAFVARQWLLLDRQPGFRWEWTPQGERTLRSLLDEQPDWLEALVDTDETVLGIGLGSSFEVRPVRHVVSSLDRVARLLIADGDVSPPKWPEALVPLAEAARAGLFAFTVGSDGEGDLYALTRPRIRLDETGSLHDWDGRPAAEWPNGHGLYFWRGVHMTESAGRRPEDVTPSRALKWTNAERRRVAIERIGLETFMRAIGAEVVQQDDYGRLWRARRHVDGEPFVAVEVVNATTEADGTRRTYFLRVPPTTRSARQAVAWTFDVPHTRYSPIAQS